MNRMAVNRLIERIFVHLFFLFFVFEIFSPMVAQRTVYIEYVFVLLNPYFLHWLFSIRFSRHVLYSILPAIILVPFHTMAAIKLVVVFVGVAFLVYSYERGLFNVIKPYLLISMAVAFVQFFATISGSSLAHTIGPTYLASLVWGPYATATFTNFYTIFLFPRVSGLSREAGFFASLVIISFFALYINSRFDKKRISKKFSASYLFSFAVSFSKASVAAALIPLIIKLRSLIDKIPLFLIGVSFLGILVAFWKYFSGYLILANSVTYLARFGGYVLLYDLNITQLIFGVADVATVSGEFARLIAQEQAAHPASTALAGLGGWCLRNGVLAFFLYTFGLQALGIRGAGFLIILLMTATVGIDTNQNFVLLSYYVAFMLARLDARKRAAVKHMPPRLSLQGSSGPAAITPVV